MSASTNPATYTTASGGDVAIVINGAAEIAGWQSVQITRSVEMVPNHFMMTMTDPYWNDASRMLVKPGDQCAVYIGTDLAITGYIDRSDAMIGPNGHDVRITGRGLCEDLLDCSADLISPDSPLHGGGNNTTSALKLAQDLCKPYGITARCALPDIVDGPILLFQAQIGETPYEIIERVARYQGYLVYEDEQGQLVLDRAPTDFATQSMASGFSQGVNVEQAASSLSMDQRFTTITIVWSTIDQANEGPSPNTSNKRASSAADPLLSDLKRYRPRIEVSVQTDGTETWAQRMADWEMARRIGRSQAVQLTCDSWRDSKGKLWTPNKFAPINLPALKMVNLTWVIISVVFRKDSNGTHADLTLMPAGALSIEPTILLPYNVEAMSTVRRTQDPPPPTTTPPSSGGP